MTPEPTWVDLGLPSGLLWAKCNVGANKPEEAGLFFSWGNVEGHSVGGGYNFSQEVYAQTAGASIENDLELSEDAARVNLGNPWRMPSYTDLYELVNNCTSIWTTVNGKQGRLFTSNINGNSIFIPAAGNFIDTNLAHLNSGGYYWSRSHQSETNARIMIFNASDVSPLDSNVRYQGLPIRPVRSA